MFILGVLIGYLLGNFVTKYILKRKYIKDFKEVEYAIDKFFEEY